MNEKRLRRVVRGILLTELSRDDRKQVEKMIDTALRKDAWDHLKKQSQKQYDDNIEKTLGVSFFGTKGKINQFVTDAIEEAIRDALAKKETHQIMADQSKKILKKLYRELAVSSPQVLDRIKI